MIFTLTLTIFGLFFLFSGAFTGHFFLFQTTKKQIGLILIAIALNIFVLMQFHRPLYQWLIVVLELFIGIGVLKQLQVMENKKVNQAIISCLDSIIVRLRSGKSFHESYQESSEVFISKYNHGNNPNLNAFILELNKIFKTRHKTLEQVLSLRKNYKIIEKLKRQSSQALFQSKFQSFFLLLIYLGVVLLQWSAFLNPKTRLVSFLSLSLFLTGTIWMLHLGKRIQWKI